MDFTINSYRNLLLALQDAGYMFQTLEQFLTAPGQGKTVILRHDIDQYPQNALRIAQIEHSMGISTSYYTRIVEGVWDEETMKQLVRLNHEASYHYEDLALAGGNLHKAWDFFNVHLDMVRQIYPAKTVCMHGNPMSKWDNRDLWKKYDYKQLGIIGEPYFDVDYSKVLYITDTGRGWNKNKASVRDKIENNKALHLKIKSTNHLIRMINRGELPEYVMINTHPQRWLPFGFKWFREWLLQSIKNVAKRGLILIRK